MNWNIWYELDLLLTFSLVLHLSIYKLYDCMYTSLWMRQYKIFVTPFSISIWTEIPPVHFTLWVCECTFSGNLISNTILCRCNCIIYLLLNFPPSKKKTHSIILLECSAYPLMFEWVRLSKKLFRSICCWFGLVHTTEIMSFRYTMFRYCMLCVLYHSIYIFCLFEIAFQLSLWVY